jgi:hypothetical protein
MHEVDRREGVHRVGCREMGIGVVVSPLDHDIRYPDPGTEGRAS